jgi:hypothetical protein
LFFPASDVAPIGADCVIGVGDGTGADALVGVGVVIGASIIVHKTQSDKFLQSAKAELTSSLEQLLKNENLHSSTQKKLTKIKKSIPSESSLDQLVQYETEIKKSQGKLSSIQQFQCNNDALINNHESDLSGAFGPSIHNHNGPQDDYI